MAAAPATLIGCSRSATSEKLKPKIRLIYLLRAEVKTGPGWPNVGYDFRPDIEAIGSALSSREIDVVATQVTGRAQAEAVAERDEQSGIDGYVVYQMDSWEGEILTFAQTGKPVLYVDFRFGGSGGFLPYNSNFINSWYRWKFRNVGFVSSSRLADVLAAVDCLALVIRDASPTTFGAQAARIRKSLTPPAGKLDPQVDELAVLSPQECVLQLKNSKIVVVGNRTTAAASSIFGIPLTEVRYSDLDVAWQGADRDEAAMLAQRWQQAALDVVDVPFETLRSSAAMYLGMKALLKTHQANAIAVNCFGGFLGGHLHAYPCLGFHELGNEGLVGACEGDVRSAATMLAFSTLTRGRPGFISDPVLDTSKRQIVYAHCVAPTKVLGPLGPASPFKLMTHSEDRTGASVRAILPANYLTTTLQLHGVRKEILLHQAVALDNDPDDRACRTKLCAEPLGDFEKLFTMWGQWGWHRVTFYGDLKPAAYALADATGWQVVEEA